MSEIDDHPRTAPVTSAPPDSGPGVQRLKPNAVGLIGVLFMVSVIFFPRGLIGYLAPAIALRWRR